MISTRIRKLGNYGPMNAVGGSTVAAVASVAVPVVAAVGGYYAYNNYISMSHNTTENNQQNLMSQIKSQE